MTDSAVRTAELDLLAALAEQTMLLQRTAESLDDVTAPSLCEGWTRGHVLTHLARNGDAMVRLCRAAVEDSGETMYDSPQGRDAEIEAGAGRPAADQARDVAATAAMAREALARLGPEHAHRQLERTPGVGLVPAARLPFMRLREVVLHHVDLDAGFSFLDVEDRLVQLLLAEEVSRLQAAKDAPDLTLASLEGDRWTVGTGTAPVGGSRAALLGWLARGLTTGVSGDPLPRLPEGR